MKSDIVTSDLDYGSVAYWLMKMQDSIQKRLYWRSDATARTEDLLRRINVSTILHTWKQDASKGRAYTIGDLMDGEAASKQLLTKLMVSAFEDSCEEIQTTQTLRPKDTDDINAWKSNEFFFWSESGIKQC